MKPIDLLIQIYVDIQGIDESERTNLERVTLRRIRLVLKENGVENI